jgi:hypothetical protein
VELNLRLSEEARALLFRVVVCEERPAAMQPNELDNSDVAAACAGVD